MGLADRLHGRWQLSIVIQGKAREKEKKKTKKWEREWTTVQKHNIKQSVRYYVDCSLKYHFQSLTSKTIAFTDIKNKFLFQKAKKPTQFYFPYVILCFIILLTGRRGQHLTD